MSREKALERLRSQVSETTRVMEDFYEKNSEGLVKAAELVGTTIKAGNKILIAGNGGSASDAQHFAGEMIGRFLVEREALPALALNTDTSVITAIGNDYGYDQVFSRQVDAFGKKGDVFFAISTSGKSPNIMKAVESAKKRGMKIVALTGYAGGVLGAQSDIHLNVGLGRNSPRIQEVHIQVIHLLVDLMDEYFLK